jgi:tight adherence protein B
MIGPALFMALLLLATGCLLVFAFTRIERAERRGFAHRVDLMIGRPEPQPGHAGPNEAAARRARFLAKMRLPFSFALARTWGVTMPTSRLYVLAVAGAMSAWLLLHLLLHLPDWSMSLCAAGMFLGLPRVMMIRQQRHAEGQFTELFPDTIDMIVRMVRAGLPVAAAIRAVGEQGAHPVSEVFVRVADRCEIGMPLEEVLADMGEDIGLADFRFFAVAVGLQRSTGGNLARTLEIFGEIIRKRRAVRLKAQAATAEVKMSAIVLGLIPFFVVGALALINPGYLLPLVTDPRGNVLVGAALASLMLGGLVMRWLIRSGTRV